ETTYGDLTGVTAAGYDSQGRAMFWADALGNTVFTGYDSLGQTLSLSGATYPVQYAYDTVGRQTELDTTRDGLAWDKTRFLFDGATGLLTNKVYADGTRVVYAYTAAGRLATRVWARGVETDYSYDTLGQPLTVDCPGTWYDVYYAYDVFGYASSSSNSFARYEYANSLSGTATNETAVIGLTSSRWGEGLTGTTGLSPWSWKGRRPHTGTMRRAVWRASRVRKRQPYTPTRTVCPSGIR
ncbi:MAG: hypothetical protein PHV28_03150, partial [Kiritimatiellae bacterium]|nr:hypothetical protein [Kiritimatiellia bacterium]